MNNDLDKLLGAWRSDPSDCAGRKGYGEITLKFGSDKSLLYITHHHNRDEMTHLTYTIEPGFIVTNQPSEPRIERTAYEFTDDGTLILAFQEEKSRYIRET
jgi:hypothetical protein